MRKTLATTLLALPGLTACGSDATSATDAVQMEDGRSAAGTIVLLLAARLPESDAVESPRFIDYRHIRQVRLRVDGQDWGLFAAGDEPTPQATAGERWAVTDAPSEALVVASIGSEVETEAVVEGRFDTVGEWARLLERHLEPGGHVAEIASLHLEDRAGDALTLEPRLFVPFEVRHGDASAFAGNVVIDFAEAAP